MRHLWEDDEGGLQQRPSSKEEAEHGQHDLQHRHAHEREQQPRALRTSTAVSASNKKRPSGILTHAISLRPALKA